jgi:hypothetical protein
MFGVLATYKQVLRLNNSVRGRWFRRANAENSAHRIIIVSAKSEHQKMRRTGRAAYSAGVLQTCAGNSET